MFESNHESFYNMMEEYVVNSVARMGVGDVTDCGGLFEPNLWKSLTELERQYLFKRNVDWLINEDVVNLEFVDCEGQVLYRKK